MYPPSMLSSAALAHSAQELLNNQINVNELINRLQHLTRVEIVSTKLQCLFQFKCSSAVFSCFKFLIFTIRIMLQIFHGDNLRPADSATPVCIILMSFQL